MQCCLVWNNTCIYIYLYICHVYKMKACYWFVTLNLYYINRYLNWNCLSSLHQVGISNELYAPSLSVFVDSRKKKIHKNLCEANTSLYRSKQGQGWYTGPCCRGLQIEVTALGMGCAIRCQRMTNFSEGAYSASEKIYRSH